MSLQFKNATEHDIPVIYQLAEKIWKQHYTPMIGAEQVAYMLDKIYSTKSIEEQMRQHQHYTLAYDGETPIGYLAISTNDTKNYFLHKFYVAVNEQGKGVGADFLKHTLSNLPNLDTLQLTVNRKNYKSINFYFKQGFIIKEIADVEIGGGFFMNDFVMSASAQALKKADMY